MLCIATYLASRKWCCKSGAIARRLLAAPSIVPSSMPTTTWTISSDLQVPARGRRSTGAEYVSESAGSSSNSPSKLASGRDASQNTGPMYRPSQFRQKLATPLIFISRGHSAPDQTVDRRQLATPSFRVKSPSKGNSGRESAKPLHHMAEPSMEEDTPPHDSRRSVRARRCKAARAEAVGRLACKQLVVDRPGRHVDPPVRVDLRSGNAFQRQ